MRHRLPFIALLVLLLPLIGFAPPPAGAQEGDVPMFRGNVARTGEMPGPGPKGDPVENWRFATGGEETSSPVVLDGFVYVGSQLNDFYALDAANGAELWRTEGGMYASSSPAVANGFVYVACSDPENWAIETLGYSLCALDAVTGEELWRFAANAWVTSSPAVVGGAVYVGSHDQHLYAIDAATGQERWTFGTGDEAASLPAATTEG
ncbi:MAG: PQQ-binding-like beta-propeller repeat protein [Thermomicrobiales bacterium]